MASVKITFTVTWAWWFRFYVCGLVTVCAVTGLQPDWAKVERVVKRALRLRVQ